MLSIILRRLWTLSIIIKVAYDVSGIQLVALDAKHYCKGGFGC